MAKAEKNSFLLYDDTGEVVKLLTDEQAGQLLKAIFCYRSGAELPELDGMTKVAFVTVKNYMDRDGEKYKATCKRRSENGKKGGRPSKPNGYLENQMKPNGFSKNQTKPKKADSDNDSENDSDSESDKNIKGRKNARFTPPTLEEVQKYCQERKNSISAQHFIDYYSARGWELSKGRKMKDWKAAVRTWEENANNWGGQTSGASDHDNPKQRELYGELDYIFES